MSTRHPYRRNLVRDAFSLRTHQLGRRVISGAGFQFLSIALRTIITIASTAILARLLMPSDFGHVSMATVVTELAALFANFGLTQILIQRKRITRLQMDTVFWASLALGTILALIVFGSSFFASLLFDDEKVGELLRVLCLTFVLGGLTAVPWVVQMRLMRFRTEFWIQITTVITRTFVAIACAYQGMGAWSLVAGALTGSLMGVILGFIVVPYRPRLRFHGTFLKATWRTSGSYFGGGMLFYANMNLDLILIGRQLGAESLGYYQNARSLTDEIRGRIAIPLQHVLFPAFSAVQNDPLRAQEMFLRSGRILAAIVIPIGIGVMALAPEIVPVLFGDKWIPMIPILSMLGISAAVRASTAIASPVINAHNKVSTALKYQIVSTALLVTGIIIALPYGLVAVAAAQAIVVFYSLVPFKFALGLLGLGLTAMWQVLGPPSIASAAAAVVIFMLRPLSIEWFAQPGWILIFHAFISASVYLAVLMMQSRRYLGDVRSIIKSFLHRS